MKRDVDIAVINTKLDEIQEAIKSIRADIKELHNDYMTKKEADTMFKSGCDKMNELEARLTERIRRLEAIVYTSMSAIGLAVIAAAMKVILKI